MTASLSFLNSLTASSGMGAWYVNGTILILLSLNMVQSMNQDAPDLLGEMSDSAL